MQAALNLEGLEQQETQERFVVDDIPKAEWALKKIAHYNKVKAKRKAEYEQMQADNERWYQQETADADRQIEYFQSLLRPFAEKELEGSKKKSVALPSGKIGFRAGAQKFFLGADEVKNDNPALIGFVKSSLPELLKVKESVDWATMKKNLVALSDGKVITKDGEIVPEMRVEVGDVKFYVEVK